MTTPVSRRRAVVTGASRGLGEVLAGFLAGSGYDLILVARTAPDLVAVADRLRARGAHVSTVVGSVADPSTRAEIRAVVEPQESLDLLVNNASELGPPGRPPLVVVPPEVFENVLRVNVVAPLALVQTLLPFLSRSGSGLVVNITSDAAAGAYPGWGAYGSSKSALDLVSRTLAAELAENHLSVVAVDPGDLRTAMHQAAFEGTEISDRPLPEATVPFWAWLFGQEPTSVSGRRFQAQAERWGEPA
ncbi:MAG: SDR family oxidoreductase [Thermoplasmata archaeon]|nr:SDR family oxidoreductase [Thermoplasmata archaeon]